MRHNCSSVNEQVGWIGAVFFFRPHSAQQCSNSRHRSVPRVAAETSACFDLPTALTSHVSRWYIGAAVTLIGAAVALDVAAVTSGLVQLQLR